jgi:hypothetical protein
VTVFSLHEGAPRVSMAFPPPTIERRELADYVDKFVFYKTKRLTEIPSVEQHKEVAYWPTTFRAAA